MRLKTELKAIQFTLLLKTLIAINVIVLGTEVNHAKGTDVVAYSSNKENIRTLRTPDPETGISHPVNLAMRPGSEINFALDPKGTFAYYIADHEIEDKWELYKADLNSSSSIKVSLPGNVDGDVHYVVSSNRGKSVFYTADNDIAGKDDLYRFDVKSGTVVKIETPTTATAFSILMPVPDRSDKNILFLGSDPTRLVADLYTVNLKTNIAVRVNRPLERMEFISSPVFANNGKSIIYTVWTPNDRRLYQYDIKKKTNREIEYGRDQYPYAFAHDTDLKGKYVLLRVDDRANNLYTQLLLDVRTGLVTPATEVTNEYAWDGKIDARGKYIVYLHPAANAIEVKLFDIKKRKSKAVMSAGNDYTEGIHGYDFDSKGRSLVLSKLKIENLQIQLSEIFRYDLKKNETTTLLSSSLLKLDDVCVGPYGTIFFSAFDSVFGLFGIDPKTKQLHKISKDDEGDVRQFRVARGSFTNSLL